MKIKNMKQVREHMKDMNIKRLFRRNQIIITTLAVMIAAAGYLSYVGKRDLASGSTVYEARAMSISDKDILTESQVASLTGQSGLQGIPSLDQDPLDLDAISDADGTQVTVDPGTGVGALAQAGNNIAVEGTTQAVDVRQTADAGQMARVGTDSSTQTSLESPGEAALTSEMSVVDYIVNVQLSREQIHAKNGETLMTLTNGTSIDEAAKQQTVQDMIKLTEVPEKGNTVETLPMVKGFSDPVASTTWDRVDVVINAPSMTNPRRVQIEDVVKRKAGVGVNQTIITLLSMAE